MKSIKLSSIEIGDRVRNIDTVYVKQLAESIRDEGLMQPIVLSNNKKLIAGGHRLEAHRMLSEGEVENENPEFYSSIPYVYFEEYLVKAGRMEKGESIDEATLRRLELEENVRRLDMSWQDKIMGVAEYHKLATKKASEDGDKWTQSQTAALLNISQGRVSTVLDLAKDLKRGDEELWACANSLEAIRVKLARKSKETAKEQERRARAQRERIIKQQEELRNKRATSLKSSEGVQAAVKQSKVLNTTSLGEDEVEFDAITAEKYSIDFVAGCYTMEIPEEFDVLLLDQADDFKIVERLTENGVALCLTSAPAEYFVQQAMLDAGLVTKSPAYWSMSNDEPDNKWLPDTTKPCAIGLVNEKHTLKAPAFSNNWADCTVETFVTDLLRYLVNEGSVVYIPRGSKELIPILVELVLKGHAPLMDIEPDKIDEFIQETHELINANASMDFGGLLM